MSERAKSRESSAPEWPESHVRTVDACLLCEGRDLLSEPFAYEFAGRRFPACRCAECGLVFLRTQPTEPALREMYGREYFESDYHCGHEDASYFASEGGAESDGGRLLDRIERRASRGRLLEVGCAGGFFLDAARNRGWETVGIEISVSASAFARERLGLDVRTGTPEGVSLEDGSVDVAFLGDVLEHVRDPLRDLRVVSRWLRPGGLLVLAGPITVNSLDRRAGLAIFRALGRVKSLRQPPYHLIEFTPGTLRRALERTGFGEIERRQFKIPPQFRNPRNRALPEHLLKLAFDLPNWLWTGVTGRAGDRILVFARRLREIP